MRIGLLSDSHLEEEGSLPSVFGMLPERGAVDVFLVAGDATRAQWAFELCCLIHDYLACPVLYTPGNHEYYYSHDMQCTMSDLDAMWTKEFAGHPSIHFLQNTHVEIDGISFFGSTWWTNFMGKGVDFMQEAKLHADLVADTRYINVRPFSDDEVSRKVSSLNRHSGKMWGAEHYKAIMGKSFFHKISADDMIALNIDCVGAYKKWYESTPGKKVLMSHFPMLRELQHAKFLPNPYFVSCNDLLIESMPPDLIAFGHTHYNYMKKLNGALCVSNQYGYTSEYTGFQNEMVIEI